MDKLCTRDLHALDRYASDRVETQDGSPLRFLFFGHASFMMRWNGYTIYLDPVGEYADYALLPEADVILVTHAHADHLDSKAVSKIAGTDTVILLNEESWRILGEGTVMQNGGRFQVGDWLTVEAVPAYNTTPGREQFHPHNGRDNGYVLTLGGSRIYVAGDTEPTPEMLAMDNLDIVFLPVNQPYTMTVTQAADAIGRLSPRIFYPYHTTDTDLSGLRTALASRPDIDLRIFPMR